MMNLIGDNDVAALPAELDLLPVPAFDSASEANSRLPLGPNIDHGIEPSPQARQSVHSPSSATTDSVAVPCVSYDLALHLLDLFFAHIQPWLPILHRPRFLFRCQRELQHGSDALAGLSRTMTLLVLGTFGLAARFSSHPFFSDTEPLSRASQFIIPARQIYGDLRGTENPTLLYLQGCVLLAFDAYTDELNSGAWILTGVCVRLAYDLGLAEIDGDDEDSLANQNTYDLIDLEEMRRAWWLTWELDTFGSLINRKPFAVDRHDFSVKLPLSDDDWFAAKHMDSAELLTTPAQAWKSLQGSENQNPRAWFLIANHLVSLLVQHLQKKRPENHHTLTEFEAGFNCLKLSWPSPFDIFTVCPRFGTETFANYNWIFGTHLMLTAGYGLLDSMGDTRSEVLGQASSGDSGPGTIERVRAVTFSQLVARWPPDYMAAAHPFLVWSFMPTMYEIRGQAQERVAAFFTAVGDTAELIIARFARKWKLAGQALGECFVLPVLVVVTSLTAGCSCLSPPSGPPPHRG